MEGHEIRVVKSETAQKADLITVLVYIYTSQSVTEMNINNHTIKITVHNIKLHSWTLTYEFSDLKDKVKFVVQGTSVLLIISQSVKWDLL